MQTSLRYLLVLALTLIVLAVGAASLAVAVDPYRFFGTRPVIGWTALKPRAYEQEDLAKTYMLQRARPTTMLLGNSRVEVGLDPENPFWPIELRPVFNGALAGHDLFPALLLLQHDLAIKPPKLVVLGVDFQDFIQAGNDPSDPAVDAAEMRMLADRKGVPNRNRDVQVFADTITSTLTIDALTDSLMTLAMQNPSSGITMTPAGFNPLREYNALIRREGAFGLFAQKRAMYEAQYRTFRPSDFHNPLANPEFRYLALIARVCASHGTRLIVITYPYHAQYLEMLHRFGLWPSFEAWKQALARVLGHAGARSIADVRLFDFANLTQFSRELIPPAGDRRTQMRWYWEEGHFKSALGDKLIARMMGANSQIGTLLVGGALQENPRATDSNSLRASRSTPR